MYVARYLGISVFTILHVQAGLIHTRHLPKEKSVAVPMRQESIHPYRAHAVLSGHCNIHICIAVYWFPISKKDTTVDK